jgi:5-dehydro-4-deoxyglucarate dehydratase
MRRQLAAGPGALFTCCGTGEFFSLSEDEYGDVVAIAVEEAAGKVPVVAGIGYGWAQAARFAAIADGAGADGALVLPHYLVEAPQPGLVQHVRELAKRTDLPLIVYQRGNVKYTAVSAVDISQLPTVVGLKDGHSDFDQLQRLRLAVPYDFLFLNGSLTAEMQARAYASIGIPTYSSSVHSFAPEIATSFFRAFHASDTKLVDLLLSSFYWPLSELRDKCAGYGVSLVKAAARLRGDPVGPVRAPLAGPSEDHLPPLERIVRKGLELVGAELVAASPL